MMDGPFYRTARIPVNDNAKSTTIPIKYHRYSSRKEGSPHVPDRTLSQTLDAISILQGRLAAAPGDPVAPLKDAERRSVERELKTIISILHIDHLGEIELRRQAASQRLHKAAFLRISRSETTRGIIERNGDWPLRMIGREGDQHVIISITYRNGFFRVGQSFPIRLGEYGYLLQITEPVEISTPVKGFPDGQSALDFLHLIDTLQINPNPPARP